MKKRIILIISIIIAAICSIALIFLAIKNNEYKKLIAENRYPNNTKITINDWSTYASGKTATDIYNLYLEEQEDVIYEIVIKEQKYNLDITDCYEHTITEEDFKSLFSQITYSDYLTNKPYEFTLNDNYTYNIDKVEAKIFDYLSTVDYKYTKSIDAIYDAENYEVIPEIYGTEIDLEKATTCCLMIITDNRFSANLDDDNLFIKPQVTADELKKEYEDILSIANWKVTYSVTDYEISMKDYMEYVSQTEDGVYIIDTSFMKQAVLELSKTVDKSENDSIQFNSTLDGEITVSGGTYGQIMDNKSEITYLVDLLEKRESVENREPIWIVPPIQQGDKGTYVEIDLSEQHVWYYEEGELVMEADCVTGTANTSRATPTGAFYVSEKVNGKYLTGPTWRSWVDKWMRLTNDGVGLHDAQWRRSSEFGGTTYKYNGSHGCINLPKQFAYDLYDAIEVGTFVVIHE